MVPAGQVQKLTGLSADQLREWSLRRGLILPDVAGNGPGRPALYSWQTVLLLRVAVVLRTRFHIELQAHRNLLLALQELLAGIPFPVLRGSILVLRDMETGELLPEGALVTALHEHDTLLIRLDPHLDVLQQKFAPQDQSSQLPLFRAVRVG
jgi:DNA-binding transcriptional MerR regulator